MSVPVTRILIISENKGELVRLQRLLDERFPARYEIGTASQARIALDMLRDRLSPPFACVLVCNCLADKSTEELLPQLKNAMPDRPCAVIVIAEVDSPAGPNFLRAGAQDYLVVSELTSEHLSRSIDHAIAREALFPKHSHGEEATRRSDERFRAVLEAARDAIVVLDQHGNIVFANAQTRATFGYTEIELLGQHAEMLVPAALRDTDVENNLRLLLEPDTQALGEGVELTGIRRDGTEFPMEVVLSPLETNEGVLISCVVRDLSEQKQMGDQLQLSSEQLRFIMDSMPPMILTTKPNGDVDYCNSQCMSFTGLKFEQIRDWGWKQFVHPDDVEEHVRRWRNAIETGKSFEFESRFRNAVGKYRWHFSRTVSMRNPSGQIEMWIGSYTDVHDIKETKAAMLLSETRYRRLFEAAKDGILILEFSTGKIVDANPFMHELLGYSHEEFLGRQLWEIGFFGDKSANEEAEFKLQKDGYLRYEHLPLESKDGRRVEVEIIANAYAEGDHQVIQCNVRDITERSQMERRLQIQAAELSDLHRRKDEFLAMLSHELRSPLAPIANAAQLLSLQEGSETRIQQQARNIIERQVKNLQHLVDDLLEVSRITSGRVQLRQEWATVNSIVEGAVETVRLLIEQRRHELTVAIPDAPLWLRGDPVRLEQVIANLLTNAAKYTEEGGQIWLTVNRESEAYVIRVRDNGVGIAPALLPHVFELFTQAERSLDRSQGGLGIGLALAQRLTQLHNGTVEAHSQPSEGSEFIVRLPFPESESTEILAPNGKRNSSARSMRVLVVDDTVDTATAFAMLLRAYGHEVRTAHDGIAAVRIAAEYHPEVMILDIGLPGLDGYEVARRIRQQADGGSIVLIALTGYGQESDRQTSIEAGFNYHMIKPADFDQLLNILETAGKAKL